MSDKPNTSSGNENPNGSENPNPGQEPNGGTENEQSKIDWSKLPDELSFLKDVVTDTRKEAANWRTQAQSYKEKVTELEGQIPDEDIKNQLQTFRTKAEENERELAKLKIISEVGIDPALGKYISGNEEEMRSAAMDLKARLNAPTPPTKTNPSGGSAPMEQKVDTSPEATLARIRAGRR